MPFLFLLLFLLLITVAYAAFSLAPWVPCRTHDLERIARVANLQPGELFYDLGCGNGRVIFYLARRFRTKEIQLTGIEIAVPFFLVCAVRKFLSRQTNVTLKCKNLFQEPLSGADVLYVFGMPEALKTKLGPKLLSELRPGTRVLSYVFPIEGLVPRTIDKTKDTDMPIYLYVL